MRQKTPTMTAQNYSIKSTVMKNFDESKKRKKFSEP
jgi:hypothetical protein